MLTLIFGPIDPDVLNEALVYFDLTSFSLIAFSIFQVIFSILRACDNIHTTIFITLGMNILNIILSIIYIYGIDYYFLDMHLYIKSYGLVGAGIAVLVSRCLGALVTVYYLLYKVKLFKLTEIRLFIPLIRSQKYILSNGWPTGSEMTLYNIGKLITQIFVVSLGPIAISANSVGSSVFNIINVIGNAFAIAAMVLTGRMVSYKNHINIKSTVYISIAFGSLLIFIFCAPIYFNTEAISNLYGVGHQVKPYINNILKLLCITVSLFWGAAFITPACLRTFGYIKYTAVIAVISMWLFRVVLGYVLAILLNMGIMGIWIGLYIDWIFRSACFIIKFKRSSVY
jgi:putative MATE family efflux protein